VDIYTMLSTPCSLHHVILVYFSLWLSVPADLVCADHDFQVQNVLAALLPEDAVHCSHRATGYIERPEAEGGGVIVHFKGQEDVCARFVVAADGMRSALRAGMVRHDPGPR
jgi:2-polyprenyl-6-methoxyphenol hydroxylase-like FAD-dependent oxidoreductase